MVRPMVASGPRFHAASATTSKGASQDEISATSISGLMVPIIRRDPETRQAEAHPWDCSRDPTIEVRPEVNGLVSIDRSMVAALLSTTPRLLLTSFPNGLALQHMPYG